MKDLEQKIILKKEEIDFFKENEENLAEEMKKSVDRKYFHILEKKLKNLYFELFELELEKLNQIENELIDEDNKIICKTKEVLFFRNNEDLILEKLKDIMGGKDYYNFMNIKFNNLLSELLDLKIEKFKDYGKEKSVNLLESFFEEEEENFFGLTFETEEQEEQEEEQNECKKIYINNITITKL